MGRWIYVNALVLLVSLVFMYLHFTNYYQPAWHVYLLASLLWVVTYALGHYIFVYKIRRKTEVRESKASESYKHTVANPTGQSARPKVVLKKERPKVDLKKKNDTHHGK